MATHGIGKTMLCGVLLLALSGLAAHAGESRYTVGDFAVDLAKTVTEKNYDSEGAFAILQKIGIELGSEDPEAQVTEGYVVESLNQLGLDLTTSNPDGTMTQPQARLIIGSFWDSSKSAGPRHVAEKKDQPNFFCKSGPGKGDFCQTDDDCPGSFCWKPPGQRKKASPSE